MLADLDADLKKQGMRRRLKPKILRYVRFKEGANPELYYREQLMLFFPWQLDTAFPTDEQEDLALKGGFDTFKDRYLSVLEAINKNKADYEEPGIDWDAVEQDMRNVEDLEAWDEIGGHAWSCEVDDRLNKQKEMEAEDLPFDIGLDMGNNSPEARSFNIKDLFQRMSDDDYRSQIRRLNKEQRCYFNHSLHNFMHSTEPFHEFLTGGAGVGKSVVTRLVIQAAERLLGRKLESNVDSLKVLVLAPTGTAAFNVDGQTVHSGLCIPVNQDLSNIDDSKKMCNENRDSFQKELADVQLLVIDEISMVGAQLLNYIRLRLQDIKGNREDFGGVHVLCVGDLYQCPAVRQTAIYNAVWQENKAIFAPNLWRENFKMYELQEIMRQKGDLAFAQLLNRMRVGGWVGLTEEDQAMLQSHCINQDDPRYNMRYPHLCRIHKNRIMYNDYVRERHAGQELTLVANDKVAVKTSPKNAARLLKSVKKRDPDKCQNLHHTVIIKTGLPVEMTQNVDTLDGLTHGAIGILKGSEDSSANPSLLWVEFLDAKRGTHLRAKTRHPPNISATWTPVYVRQAKIQVGKDPNNCVVRTQFPVIPASASTVHHAQGLTLKEGNVDLGGHPCAGVGYTAFSRFVSFDQVWILNLHPEGIIVSKGVQDEMARMNSYAKLQLSVQPLPPAQLSELVFMHQNVRSLPKHLDDLRADVNFESPDVVFLTEAQIKLTPKEALSLNNFHLHTCSGANQSGHEDIVIYSLSDLSASCHQICQPGLNMVHVPIIKNGSLTDFVCVYKSPTFPASSMYASLNTLLEKCQGSIVLLGDFNVDYLKADRKTADMKEWAVTWNLTQHIKLPSTVYGSLLDHIWSNESVSCGTHPAYWSDHSMVWGRRHLSK